MCLERIELKGSDRFHSILCIIVIATYDNDYEFDKDFSFHSVHECGHALVSLLTPNYPAVDKITIIPRGEALGYVSNVMDEKYLYSITRQDLINRIDVALAGRAAEEVILG